MTPAPNTLSAGQSRSQGQASGDAAIHNRLNASGAANARWSFAVGLVLPSLPFPSTFRTRWTLIPVVDDDESSWFKWSRDLPRDRPTDSVSSGQDPVEVFGHGTKDHASHRTQLLATRRFCWLVARPHPVKFSPLVEWLAMYSYDMISSFSSILHRTSLRKRLRIRSACYSPSSFLLLFFSHGPHLGHSISTTGDEVTIDES